jgi:hypothetical protein
MPTSATVYRHWGGGGAIESRKSPNLSFKIHFLIVIVLVVKKTHLLKIL